MKRSTNEEIACVLNVRRKKTDQMKKLFIEEGIKLPLVGEIEAAFMIEK